MSERAPYFPARPTTYKGIRMRSRLEATFAANMDQQGGMAWAYEPRAYANARGQYLPDFQILEVGGRPVIHPIFFEVRPTIERAYLAMNVMPIIWDSEPSAWLCIAVPYVIWFGATSDRRVWETIG